MLITIVVICLAVAIALAVNRRAWRPRQDADRISSDGLQLKEVTGPLTTLAVLLLAFVLVQSFSSWTGARDAETAEAAATLRLFREADLIPDTRVRDEVQRQVICYATSVIALDWPAMADRKISNVPPYWSTVVREEAIRQLRSGDGEAAGDKMVDRDGERAFARQERIAESSPSVPSAMYWLLLLAVAVALIVIGVATSRDVGRGVHVVALVTAAIVFGCTLLLIHDLDQPYDGITAREPDQTAHVRGLMQAEVTGPLPCDERGVPTDVPGFRPQTTSVDEL